MRPDSEKVDTGQRTSFGGRVLTKRERVPSTVAVEVINKTGDLQIVSVCPSTPFWLEQLEASGKIVIGYTDGGWPANRLTQAERLRRLAEVGITFKRVSRGGGFVDEIVVEPGSEVAQRRAEMADALAYTRRNKPAQKATLQMAAMYADAHKAAQQMVSGSNGSADAAALIERMSERMDKLEAENQALRERVSEDGPEKPGGKSGKKS